MRFIFSNHEPFNFFFLSYAIFIPTTSRFRDATQNKMKFNQKNASHEGRTNLKKMHQAIFLYIISNSRDVFPSFFPFNTIYYSHKIHLVPYMHILFRHMKFAKKHTCNLRGKEENHL